MVKLGRTESPALSERAQRLAVAVEAACQEPSLGGGEIEEVVLSDREALRRGMQRCQKNIALLYLTMVVVSLRAFPRVIGLRFLKRGDFSLV